jgi:D-3-phosphoglycerate dehydrogenase
MSLRCLVADKMDAAGLQSLTDMGLDVTFNPKLDAADLPAIIAPYTILIVRSTKVQAPTLEAAENLKLVIRAGSGVNTIDCKLAKEKGVRVCNTPGMNAAAVVELAIGHLICCDRRIPLAHRKLIGGEWLKGDFQSAHGLRGRTLGVLGKGNIATLLFAAAKGLGMHVACWSRSLTPEMAEEMGVEYCDCPMKVAEISDAVSINLAYSPALKHFVGAEFLGKMKKGAILVNTSRGDLVDTAALKDAIREKCLRVGLDVYEAEPAKAKDVFADTELMEMVMSATPHVGASTDEASEAVAAEALLVVADFVQKGEFRNCVNM